MSRSPHRAGASSPSGALETLPGGPNGATNGARSCEVAIARPFLGTLAYSVPAELTGRVRPGVRVRVPLGRGHAVGVVDRLGLREDRDETPRLKPLEAVLDPRPVVDARLLRLCRWIADYYVAPLGVVLKTALPPGLLGGRADRGERPTAKTERALRLVTELETLTARDETFGRAHRQREAFESLEAIGGSASLAHLTGQLGFSRSVLEGLVEKGLAEWIDRTVERDPFSGETPDRRDIVLTPEQLNIVHTIERSLPAWVLSASGATESAHTRVPERGRAGVAQPEGGPARGSPPVALIRGVTGSGKTVVYLEILERVVGRGGSGIVLVPEISLTPQTVERFRARFGDAVAVLHSGLSDGERYDAWRALRDGRKQIAIGPRSAVFAPLPNLGAIIVDEEHEGSYKQSDTPRYHARSVAIVRATMEGCVCLLGSATPSLESWENARDGKYRLFELHERVTGQGLPPVELIDLRDEGEAGARDGEKPAVPRANGRPGPGGTAGSGDRGAAGPGPGGATGGGRGGVAGPGRGAPPGTHADDDVVEPGPRILSERLADAIQTRLDRGEQSILFLNRRGYASFVQCRSCGFVWSCESCSVTLTYHRRRRRLVCHHCGFETAPPRRCDQCGDPSPQFTGIGTEQVERRIAEHFPAARIARMDLDTTGSKWSHFEILESVRDGRVDILLGTQMIAKGLDFPNVTLVGVINADVGLHIPDFRASERTFQLLEQVAGRAGRGREPGQVLVQTMRPAHFALQRAAAHDFVGFAERELEERRELGYPPARRLANLVVSGRDEDQVIRASERISEWTRGLIRDRNVEGIDVVGPAPCPIERLRNRWRWHFFLKADSPGTLGSILRFLAEQHGQPGGDLRFEIDRDPEALL